MELNKLIYNHCHGSFTNISADKDSEGETMNKRINLKRRCLRNGDDLWGKDGKDSKRRHFHTVMGLSIDHVMTNTTWHMQRFIFLFSSVHHDYLWFYYYRAFASGYRPFASCYRVIPSCYRVIAFCDHDIALLSYMLSCFRIAITHFLNVITISSLTNLEIYRNKMVPIEHRSFGIIIF
jgi:hypothetical protein